jgi:hypothetical protein
MWHYWIEQRSVRPINYPYQAGQSENTAAQMSWWIAGAAFEVLEVRYSDTTSDMEFAFERIVRQSH